MERVRTERDRFVGGVLKSVEKFPEAHRLMGHARFAQPFTRAFRLFAPLGQFFK